MSDLMNEANNTAQASREVDDLQLITDIAREICANGNEEAIREITEVLAGAKVEIWKILQNHCSKETLDMVLSAARSHTEQMPIETSRRAFRAQILKACPFSARRGPKKNKEAVLETLINNLFSGKSITLAEAITLHGDNPNDKKHILKVRKFLGDVEQRLQKAGLPINITCSVDCVEMTTHISIPQK